MRQNQLKTVNVRQATHRKLQKIKAARRWRYSDFIDMAADRELAAIEAERAEARKHAGSPIPPASVATPN